MLEDRNTPLVRYGELFLRDTGIAAPFDLCSTLSTTGGIRICKDVERKREGDTEEKRRVTEREQVRGRRERGDRREKDG